MAVTRKRKHAAPSDENAPAQADITAFTTISKFKTEAAGNKKRKTAHPRESTPPTQPQKQLAGPHADKKRKKRAEPDDEDAPAADNSIFKRFAKGQDVSTPRNKRFKDMRPFTPAETPSKDTAALFDKLRLGPKAEAIPFPFTTNQLPDTPPHTPEPEKSEPSFLPPELQDLVSLHAAFLSALSMYYAHNGTSAPVDLQPLLAMTTKTYKKRSLTLDDMRRLLAVELERPAFQLLDFGRAGICLTKSQPRGRATKRATSFVDEVELNASFEDALRAAWSRHAGSAASSSEDASAFVNQMPLMDIVKDESVEKTAPIFARGHQRLAELKAGQAAARREPTPTPEVEIRQKSTQATQSRGSNLLDRILAKQAHTASLPAGPTREQLERKAALHRIEDIARILDLLAAGRARCSFSMQAMVQQLQQSLRNPISREEVERCLGLMAKEITPGLALHTAHLAEPIQRPTAPHRTRDPKGDDHLGEDIQGLSGRRYMIERILQDKHMPLGRVCLARNGGAKYVVKEIPQDYGVRQSIYERVQDRAPARKPFDSVPERRILVFEYRDTHLLRFAQREVPTSQIKAVLKQVLQAIAELHGRNVVHDDIKPNNVFFNVGCSNNGMSIEHIQLADLEDAEYLPPNKAFQGTQFGNRMWRSPEAHAEEPVKRHSDMFSFGLVAIIMAVDRPSLPKQVAALSIVVGRQLSYCADPSSHEAFMQYLDNDNPWRKVFDAQKAAFNKTNARLPSGLWQGEGLDEEFKDLIAGMINFDPEERLTAQQASEHTWFKGV